MINKSSNVLFFAIFLALPKPVLSDQTRDWAILADLVKAKAAVVRSRNPMDPGRLSILEEMEKHSSQLGKDIDRMSIINVNVNNSYWAFWRNETKSFPIESRKEKTSIEVYKILANTLAEYVKSYDDPKNPFYNDRYPDKLGLFWTAEIIYPIVQTFNSIPLKAFYTDTKLFTWHSRGDDPGTKLWADIIYSPETGIITVTSTSEKNLVDTAAMETDYIKKRLKTVNQTHFHLASGKVTFSFSYSFDGMKKEWTKGTPF